MSAEIAAFAAVAAALLAAAALARKVYRDRERVDAVVRPKGSGVPGLRGSSWVLELVNNGNAAVPVKEVGWLGQDGEPVPLPPASGPLGGDGRPTAVTSVPAFDSIQVFFGMADVHVGGGRDAFWRDRKGKVRQAVKSSDPL